MWRNYRWFGIALGDHQARLWAGPVNRLQRWTLRVSDGLQNRVRLSPFALTPGRLEAFMGTIASFKPHYIYGYGQSLYRLAAYVLDHHLDLGDVRPKAVITTAERLFDHQRKAIATAFGAPVVDEYGCTEAGVIDMQCPQGRLHVMADHLLIETVRDGRAVGPGQEGDILITELYGSLMPLIRYKVGDRGILSKESCPCGGGLPVLAKFTGRTTDHIVCPGGTVIDPDIVDFFLKARRPLYEAVRQWHVQQISQSKLLITLCTRGAQSQIEVASYLEEMFRTVSRDLEIQFQYEDWLGPETSGKTRIFTNLSLTSP